jgi:hypothetical protein
LYAILSTFFALRYAFAFTGDPDPSKSVLIHSAQNIEQCLSQHSTAVLLHQCIANPATIAAITATMLSEVCSITAPLVLAPALLPAAAPATDAAAPLLAAGFIVVYVYCPSSRVPAEVSLADVADSATSDAGVLVYSNGQPVLHNNGLETEEVNVVVKMMKAHILASQALEQLAVNELKALQLLQGHFATVKLVGHGELQEAAAAGSSAAAAADPPPPVQCIVLEAAICSMLKRVELLRKWMPERVVQRQIYHVVHLLAVMHGAWHFCHSQFSQLQLSDLVYSIGM